MKKMIILLILLSLVIGCDKIRPDIHPDKKGEEKGWFFGFNFKTDW